MTTRTTAAQRDEIVRAIQASNRYRNEKLWTYLVADILARSPSRGRYIQMLCGGEQVATDRCNDVWFEAQPISPRKGTREDTEKNTRLDLALGDIRIRGTTAAGIEYAPADNSYVCFAEAKLLSDSSVDVEHDPLRNQLTRVIECLLTFQGAGAYPSKIYFTLLTPRLFREKPTARLYGFKFEEYRRDRSRIAEDISACRIPERSDADWQYPRLKERLEALHLSWVTYEEILETELGVPLDLAETAMTGRCRPELEARLLGLGSVA